MDKRRILVVGGFSLASFALGVFVGRKTAENEYHYRVEKLAKLFLSRRGEEVVVEEVDEPVVGVARGAHKRVIYSNPEEAFRQLHPDSVAAGNLIDSLGYRGAEVTTNIFDELRRAKHLTPTLEHKEVTRSDQPYVITQEDFMNTEVGYSQSTLTYFSGDDVLVDEDDDPIEDVDGVIGLGNLDRFGQLSKDPKVVYIRNDRMDADYEVLLSTSTYASDVLGEITE